MNRIIARPLTVAVTVLTVWAGHAGGAEPSKTRPSVVFLFADQWRAQAVGYAGDPNAKTPHLDRLAAEGMEKGSEAIFSKGGNRRACVSAFSAVGMKRSALSDQL